MNLLDRHLRDMRPFRAVSSRHGRSVAGVLALSAIAAAAILGTARANVSSSTFSVATVSIVDPSSASQQGQVEGAVPVMSAAMLAAQVARASAPGLSSPPIVRPAATPSRASTESAMVDDAVSRANFVIVGDRDQSISVTVPSTLPLVRVGGDEVVTFATSNDLPDNGVSVRMASADGVLAFNVGGHIENGGDRVAGRYSGVLRVTAQYN